MINRTILMIVLGLAFATASAVGVWQFVANPKTVEKEIETTGVYVVGLDIPTVGTEITESMIRQIQWPTSMANSQYIKDKSEIVGKYSAVPLFEGEPLSSQKVGEESGLAAVLSEGMVGCTVEIRNESAGVAGFVRPGDRVDVLLTREEANSDKRRSRVTQRLLQEIQVIAVGPVMDRSDDNQIQNVRSITFAVEKGVDQKLTLAQQTGDLTLVLRGGPDGTTSPTNPFYETELTGAEEKPGTSVVDRALLVVGEATAGGLGQVASGVRDGLQALAQSQVDVADRQVEIRKAELEQQPVPEAPRPKRLPFKTLRGSMAGTGYILLPPETDVESGDLTADPVD